MSPATFIGLFAGPAASWSWGETQRTPAGSEIAAWPVGIWPGEESMPEVMRVLERHFPEYAHIPGRVGRLEIRLVPEDQRGFAADPNGFLDAAIDIVGGFVDEMFKMPNFNVEEAARAGHVTGLVLVTDDSRGAIIWGADVQN